MAKLKKKTKKVNISDLSSQYPNLAACLATREDLDRIEAIIPHLDRIEATITDSQQLSRLISTDFCDHVDVFSELSRMQSAYLISTCERNDFFQKAELIQAFMTNLCALLVYHKRRFVVEDAEGEKILKELTLR